MKDHSGSERGFTQLSKAWYGKYNLAREDIQDEIMIGMYHPDGETSGEFDITWERLSNSFAPALKAFDDSWSALVLFKDVLEALAELDDSKPSADEIAELLESLGVKNMTQTERQ